MSENNTADSYVRQCITRFASPLGYIDTINPYAYCGNNPVNWIDPSGKFWHIIGGGVLGGIIGAITEGIGRRPTWSDCRSCRRSYFGSTCCKRLSTRYSRSFGVVRCPEDCLK
ncbi:RHS repeat-associated core domain-containing protein [Sedimentisphaera salicampi]|uniref:RHS repeat-associated core domain-containing protein n=1 Tax=Sedimentisphaera salicampi TaxID=1941349 RepID=UPI0036F1A081